MRKHLLALLVAVTLPVAAWAQADGVQDVIGAQIEAFRAKEHAEAFSHAAPQIQLMFRNQERFASMVQRGYAPIYGAQSWRFGRSKPDGKDTMYQEVMLTGPDGRSWVALYTMRRSKDGTWKIAGVRLVPSQEQTT